MSDTLPRAAGLPPIRGRLRTMPEDFQVVEDLGFDPSGAGEHVLLRVRKREANTEWVARRLAAWAGVPAREVGFAGLKDRNAVTVQWFSVRLAGRPEPDWSACGDESFTVLEYHPHDRKLRRGALKGNVFRIVVRDMEGNRTELESRLARLAARGAPNYFGAQRFGHSGGNLARAEAMFLGEERVRDRHRRSLYLSAARSEIFNQLLARRVAEDTWSRPLPGDVMMLEGSHSVFAAPEADDLLERRAAVQDIHPTGPLWGRGDLASGGGVRVLEEALAALFPVFRQGLEEAGLKQERRALRVKVTGLELESVAADVVALHFRLPAGAYATTVLRELVDFTE